MGEREATTPVVGEQAEQSVGQQVGGGGVDGACVEENIVVEGLGNAGCRRVKAVAVVESVLKQKRMLGGRRGAE
jgi:hypothetical protein